MGAALGWGALAASSLVIGVGLAFVRKWELRPIGLILAFGAGALISAVSLELAEEGLRLGSAGAVATGLAVGALTYFTADGMLERRDKRAPGAAGGDSGTSLALGAFLDGVPEQAVLGIGLAGGEPISVALLVAIFVSNLPEGIGAGSDMQEAGMTRAAIFRLFLLVAVICTLASGVGYGIAESVSPDFQAGINGFAAGALLVMLTDSMIPEAREKGGRPAGLIAVVGFAVGTALSSL